MNIEKILAKDNGETLFNHTNKLIEISNYLFTIFKVENKDYILKACKLHDIGKIKEEYQLFFNNTPKKKPSKFLHNVYSWAFCLAYINDKDISEIANLCLWHHGNINDCSDLNYLEVIKDISDVEINNMKSFAKSQGFTVNDDINYDVNDERHFYNLNNYYRSLLIFIDSCASANLSVEEIENITKKESFVIENIVCNERTTKQLEIISNISKNNTNVIKASAGFGKTMIGILWSLFRTNKLIWVCPTNTITSEVYNNIINDLKILSPTKNVSVELYLSGERKNATNIELEDFSSDIIVTNIDNFVKATADNSFAKRAMMIYSSDVIFDEVHELYSMECALLKAFENIMEYRHHKLDVTTLLLSATPTVFKFSSKQGGDVKEVNYLPNKDSHYIQFNQQYKFNFIEESEIEESIKKIKTNNFAFFSNTVQDTQQYYSHFNDNKLICHGRYTDEDKKNKKTLVFENYGKEGKKLDVPVFCNQILGTACDYSVNNMFIITPTIISLFQALGRTNRWNTYNNSEVFILNKYDRSNSYFLGDGLNLQKMFIEKFKEFLSLRNYTASSEELYNFYNSFINKNNKEVNNELFTILRNSMNLSDSRLKCMYPFKYKNKDKDSKVKAGSNGWRKTESLEIYISVENKNNDDRITLPFSSLFDLHDIFEENSKTLNNQIKVIKKFHLNNDMDYLIKKNKLSRERMLNNAINYETPYVVFNHKYDSDMGLQKIK